MITGVKKKTFGEDDLGAGPLFKTFSSLSTAHGRGRITLPILKHLQLGCLHIISNFTAIPESLNTEAVQSDRRA